MLVILAISKVSGWDPASAALPAEFPPAKTLTSPRARFMFSAWFSESCTEPDILAASVWFTTPYTVRLA